MIKRLKQIEVTFLAIYVSFRGRFARYISLGTKKKNLVYNQFVFLTHLRFNLKETDWENKGIFMKPQWR